MYGGSITSGVPIATLYDSGDLSLYNVKMRAMGDIVIFNGTNAVDISIVGCQLTGAYDGVALIPDGGFGSFKNGHNSRVRIMGSTIRVAYDSTVTGSGVGQHALMSAGCAVDLIGSVLESIDASSETMAAQVWAGGLIRASGSRLSATSTRGGTVLAVSGDTSVYSTIAGSILTGAVSGKVQFENPRGLAAGSNITLTTNTDGTVTVAGTSGGTNFDSMAVGTLVVSNPPVRQVSSAFTPLSYGTNCLVDLAIPSGQFHNPIFEFSWGTNICWLGATNCGTGEYRDTLYRITVTNAFTMRFPAGATLEGFATTNGVTLGVSNGVYQVAASCSGSNLPVSHVTYALIQPND